MNIKVIDIAHFLRVHPHAVDEPDDVMEAIAKAATNGEVEQGVLVRYFSPESLEQFFSFFREVEAVTT